MTLPSIETALAARNIQAADLSEAGAKTMVFDAIETDLAAGIAYLRKYQRINWNAGLPQEERCIHCELPDINTRKQVVRLAAYHPLRVYVKERLGLLIALHNFRPTSSDGGPSGRLAVEPVERRMFSGMHVMPGELKVSPAQTWQVMQWGKGPMPERLGDKEATDLLWSHAETHLSGGLAHLYASAENEDRMEADGALIPEMIQLIGVPGMHAVISEKLGKSFQFYNCCGSQPVEKKDEKKVLEEISFKTQLIGQANSEMMDC